MSGTPVPTSSGRGPTVWALITGLAVGFTAGREFPRVSGDSGGSGEAAAPRAASPGGGSGKAYKSQAEFPGGWLKEADLTSLTWAGLSEAQKTTALQALNERNCECGCNMGSIATCVKRDPNCPRNPRLSKLAIDMARDGKPLAAILSALDADQKSGTPPSPAAAPSPGGAKNVQIAAWSPRKGPKAAKVTLVEFSDFQ